MPLDPLLRSLRDERSRSGVPPLYTLTVEQARAADLAAVRATAARPRPLHEVTDRRFRGPAGDLPVRVYRPRAGRPLPVLLHYFGGGWTLGGIDTSDALCRDLAVAADCLVVTVGYRLAPEHPFPAAVHDCYAALRWVVENAAELGADPSRLAVGGDSAGGNLAAAVTLLARDLPLTAQLLVYPNTDQLADDGSLREHTDPWLFNHRSVAWYRGHYLPPHLDAAHPLASPLRAPDLSGLPPALVLTAEYDPLRDQGEAYAARLAAAGVPTELVRHRGMAHGFFTMTGVLPAARAANARAAAFLRDRFAAAARPGKSA
ncbi:alpha/beta hydrolase [Kitasatospora sp. NPDC088391]|uniref:alpha/beta hydrolase n=1 Tax=Kitasatospora sp. NPDC088391 TaxID=3364074 RepID=UPI00382E230C